MTLERRRLENKITDAILFCLNDICHTHTYTYTNAIPLSEFVKQILKFSRATYYSTIGVLILLIRIKHNPNICNRKLFLASVIANHRMIYDKTLPYQAWVKITGLPKKKIESIFNDFVKFIDYNLYVKQEEYSKVDTILRSNLDFKLLYDI